MTSPAAILAEQYAPSLSIAALRTGGRTFLFQGRWVEGTPWERFGLYNSYVVVRPDGHVLRMPAHAGELVPGSTEDLVEAIKPLDESFVPAAPMTLELDPTYACASRDCGGFCFSAPYRAAAPGASISLPLLEEIIGSFASAGGRIVRFDGGGDPLMHPAVRSGEIVEFAARRGLKTNILTSGDLLVRAGLSRFANAGCYVRISLNAASDTTRRAFHGNAIPLSGVLSAVERLAACLEQQPDPVPIGATFLLAPANYHEVLACAEMARDSGIQHFSVRRILGPGPMRPRFAAGEEAEAAELLERVRAMHSEGFRVAVPWRSLHEPDLNPSAGDFRASRCWQSTLKTVIEPAPAAEGADVRLCGRYRGGGAGQLMTLPPLVSLCAGQGWLEGWRESFFGFAISRESLPRACASCIDRGFIKMVDRLVRFVGECRGEFRILHLDSADPVEEICRPVGAPSLS